MIIPVDRTNIHQAAAIHSLSWQESHRSFCSADFIALHTPEHQQEYLSEKISRGSRVFMLVDGEPAAVVSVTGSLIEDLYVLPGRQNKGYGTLLLEYAVRQCTGTPTLWILENNKGAERLYRRMGFRKTGRVHAVTDGLDEIEFTLTET
uniref:Putative acetyltransferase n=1 Tax=uncultured bacterium Contigcl_7 TaxID=1393677 RepID=W0FR55_9BACT|nr:putative acetyltransferase [uncultured bacterium Contigcl_7]